MFHKISALFSFFLLKKVRVKDGEKREILSIGLACSECFSGPRLASILKPGFDYEQKVMTDLMNTGTAGNNSYCPAGPLSIHTSGGVPMALSGFIDAIEQHLPWKNSKAVDWCVSLQIEGASAVWAAIDLLLQVNALQSNNNNNNNFNATANSNNNSNMNWRNKVAVGRKSYHGPPSTSAGAKTPLWTKEYQLTYPVPVVGEPIDAVKLITEYREFLDIHGDEIGVLVVEPQWGSSQAALPWPKDLLKMYIVMAQERGIKVLADEIMCGLGRHGQGTLFLSEAWDLDPDAVTFGKLWSALFCPIMFVSCKLSHLDSQSRLMPIQRQSYWWWCISSLRCYHQRRIKTPRKARSLCDAITHICRVISKFLVIVFGLNANFPLDWQ